MHKQLLTLGCLLAMLALGAPGSWAQGVSAQSKSTSGMSAGSQQMHGSMMRGMQHMQRMQMSGDADRDFATMMRMHHQQGMEMAKEELQQGKSQR